VFTLALHSIRFYPLSVLHASMISLSMEHNLEAATQIQVLAKYR
jgi:hypothetical protein